MVPFLGSLVAAVFAMTLCSAAHEATMRGLILATVPAKGEVVVRHGAMLGKPAGIATFRVLPPSHVKALRIGESISATADTDETPWTLESIAATGTEAVTGAAPAAFNAGSTVLRNVHHVAVGEFVPAATFTDQRGKPFELGSLHGQMVVMAFIYTRCKDGRACPLISAKFHTLQQKLLGRPVHLVEVTLDPSFDRPRVLAAYGQAFGSDPERWTLATGDPDKVLDFAAQFDVTAFPDERIGLIHPERTVIIDQYGTIRELIDEASWSPDEVVATIDHDQHLASNPFERFNLWLSEAAVAVCGNSVAGFSGFTDLITVVGISLFFGFLLWKLGRTIARGAT